MNSFRDRQAAIKKLRLLVFSPKTEIGPFREKIEEAFRTVFLPNNVDCTEHRYGGIPCDVLVPGMSAAGRLLLYIHGGSFIGGSRASWRSFCSVLANAASSRTIVPEFRLPPESAFPASLEDIQAAFRGIYSEELSTLSNGTPSAAGQVPDIIIMADGSGAALALALVASLRGSFRAAVRQVVLFSPWLDLTSASPVISGHKVADDVMSGEVLRRSADLYTHAENLSNPLVSPLHLPAEQLAGFPPVYIQLGEKEILLDDAKRYKALLDSAGIRCTLDVWPGMMHLFQMADEYLTEAHLAIERVGALITRRSSRGACAVHDGSLTLEHSLHSDS
jgi:epsilon-lactone hydrolase